MPEAGRLYVVSDSETGNERLVDAANPAQAIRHVARGRGLTLAPEPSPQARMLYSPFGILFSAVPASPRDAARLVKAGIDVEDASADPPEGSA